MPRVTGTLSLLWLRLPPFRSMAALPTWVAKAGTAPAGPISDLQARIYVGTTPPEGVRGSALSVGRAAAERFFRPVQSSTR